MNIHDTKLIRATQFRGEDNLPPVHGPVETTNVSTVMC